MSNEITKPLYKVLNEQRTQGEASAKYSEMLDQNWLCINKTNVANFCGGEYDNEIDSQTSKANAQYTALAVNNLHLLAEALEAVIKVADRKTVEFDKAKEALNRIS